MTLVNARAAFEKAVDTLVQEITKRCPDLKKLKTEPGLSPGGAGFFPKNF